MVNDRDPQSPDRLEGGTADQGGGTPAYEEKAERAEVGYRKGKADPRHFPARGPTDSLDPLCFRLACHIRS
jgi:hypothetical protein